MSIRVDNIVKRFGTFAALHGVSLEARPGEFLALLGPSGSGKTTLLRIMAGLEFPDEGRIMFDGQEVTGFNVKDRQIGFVFQNYALFPHMNVLDNIAFGLTVKKRSERPSRAAIRARAAELLDLVQLGHLGKRYPAQLSGGQRQRVALARALAMDPKLLLLDEPFGALDAKVRKELRRWLRDLHNQMGVTSVFVTHDQEEALELADRVVVMDHGVISQVAAPQEVYEQPASAFVYEFVGDSVKVPVTVAAGRAAFLDRRLALPVQPHFEGAGNLFFRPHDVRLVENENGALPFLVHQSRQRGGIIRIEGAIPGLDRPVEIIVAEEQAPASGMVGLELKRASLFPSSPDAAVSAPLSKSMEVEARSRTSGEGLQVDALSLRSA